MKAQFLSRVYLIVIFAVFFAPLLFAMWLYFGANSWLTTKTQNHGELIQPPRSLQEFAVTSEEGTTWRREQFLGKWTLLYLGNENCDLYCEASLFKMRLSQMALGHDSQRIQRMYLCVSDHTSKDNLDTVFKKYPRMQVNWFERSQLDNQLSQFKDLTEHEIYLIDPLGNLIMHYSKSATAKGIKNDLKRLLKVSRIG